MFIFKWISETFKFANKLVPTLNYNFIMEFCFYCEFYIKLRLPNFFVRYSYYNIDYLLKFKH